MCRQMYSDLSHITCPACGKSSSLGNFPPERMDLDIHVYSVRGLGRGRGFEVTESKSILYSPEYQHLRQRFAARISRVLGLLVEIDAISKEQVIQGLGLDQIVKAPLAAMEEKLKQ